MLEYGIYIVLKYANIEINNVLYSCIHERPEMFHFQRIKKAFDYKKPIRLVLKLDYRSFL